MIRHDIPSADGTNLAVFEAGPPNGFPMLLIHGWSQHHLSWAQQLGSPLARQFRMIAPDLRGHGASDKPDAAEAYNHSAPWAADIAAILEALALDKPLLVGWSMGGWVVQDYLKVHGAGKASGVMLIGSSITTGKHSPEEARARRAADPEAVAAGMYSDDQAENLSATVAFIEACFAETPKPNELAYMVGFNMLVPPHIRHACRKRHEDYRPLWDGLDLPTAIVWGVRERLCLPPMMLEMREHLPKAQILAYNNCGHSPFWEDPRRFNTDMATFAMQCREGAA